MVIFHLSSVSSPSSASWVIQSLCLEVFYYFFLMGRHVNSRVRSLNKRACESQLLSDEMVGEPVHEDGLRCCYRHGEVHPQLVPGSSHQLPLSRRLREELQTQRADLLANEQSLLQRLTLHVKPPSCCTAGAGARHSCNYR